VEQTVEIRLERASKEEGQPPKVICTTLKRCANEIELAPLRAQIEVMVQTNSSFKALEADLRKRTNGASSSDAERVEAFDALVTLEEKLTKRVIGLASNIFAFLEPRTVSGAPLREYSLNEIGMAALRYLEAHSLTEQERKN
jgi:hypothetical protein